MTVQTYLREEERNLAPRPLPAGWADTQPELGSVETFHELFTTIRAFGPVEPADRLLLALLRLPARSEPRIRIDPRVVALVALAPRAYWQHRPPPGGAVNDLYIELTALLCEPGLADQLADRHRLVDLLNRRAGRRWNRRFDAAQRYTTRTAPVDPLVLATLVVDNAHNEMEETVTTRVALGHLHRDVATSIQRGTTTTAQWTNYLTTVLAPAIDHHPAGPRNSTRARRNLAHHITRAFAA
jgi:hypothetical protein